HLADFEKDLALGLASRSRRKREPSAGQVALVVQRVRDVLAGCGFEHPADLNDAAPARVAAFLRGRVGRPVAEGGLSHQSPETSRAPPGRLVWWRRKRGPPVRAALLADVPAFAPANNRAPTRRAVSAGELTRVLDAALASPRVYRRLRGADRYHVYLTA